MPRSALAAVGMLLIASAACTVADPSSIGAPDPSSIRAPAPSSGIPPTVVAAEPTETSASEMPIPPEPAAAVRRPAHKMPRAALPRPDHIVVVVFENKHRSSVTSSGQAPYLNKLAAKGANMTHSYGVTHPSQPNYPLDRIPRCTANARPGSCPTWVAGEAVPRTGRVWPALKYLGQLFGMNLTRRSHAGSRLVARPNGLSFSSAIDRHAAVD